ncbi:ABC transporter permease [Insolitispirillum peregrinum]|uniref:Amino acid ABC transporter membrane protein 1, PAAT family n=1 Tax=Insolitispirillum peregrinum TaxID=80876 RepID=A0A1N7JHY6_9PROT|nr:ABC transporter permease [Insolitispirillum peregrinum]SIS48876.1 amino acid ABC transporter membrane protein 1, PAAT family [Insolitispirillum peregrinum]
MDLHGFGPLLLEGVLVTVEVAVTACAVGLMLGLAGAVAKLSEVAALRWLAEVYTTLFRGLPEFLVVLIVYFAGAAVLTATIGGGTYVDVPPFIAGSLALATTFGAYATEVFRGAIQAIPQGHVEAGLALGLSRRKIFWRLVMPQVMRYALPGLGNLFLVLLKDTALVSMIGVSDLMRQADIARGATRDTFTFYAIAAVMYLTLTAITTAVLARLEQRANRGVRRA